VQNLELSIEIAGLFLGLAVMVVCTYYWSADLEAEMIMEEEEPSESSQEIQTLSRSSMSPRLEINDDEKYILIAKQKPALQLKSGQFVTLSCFFAIHAT
jgi:hypothetical protein